MWRRSEDWIQIGVPALATSSSRRMHDRPSKGIIGPPVFPRWRRAGRDATMRHIDHSVMSCVCLLVPIGGNTMILLSDAVGGHSRPAPFCWWCRPPMGALPGVVP